MVYSGPIEKGKRPFRSSHMRRKKELFICIDVSSNDS